MAFGRWILSPMGGVASIIGRCVFLAVAAVLGLKAIKGVQANSLST